MRSCIAIYTIDPAAERPAEITRDHLGANRLRDLAISDGRTIYLATDSQGDVQNAEGGANGALENAVQSSSTRRTDGVSASPEQAPPAD